MVTQALLVKLVCALVYLFSDYFPWGSGCVPRHGGRGGLRAGVGRDCHRTAGHSPDRFRRCQGGLSTSLLV